MAIANGDGSIVLSTKVDTSGINKGMSQMQGKATSLTKTFSKLGAAIASAFAVQKIIQFSKEAGRLATQTEASVQRLVDIYGSASDSVGDFIDANARALGMSKAAAASFSSVYGNLFSVWADQSTNAELTNKYLNMTAVVASKTGRTVEDVQERVRSGLLGNTEAIEDLGIFVNVKTIEITDAFQRMANGKSWEQLDAYTQQQIRSMAILEQATAKYGNQVAQTSATVRNRFHAAYQDFQNTWGQFVNTILLPVLEVLTKIFDIATRGMNALMGNTGNIVEGVEVTETESSKTAENIEEQTENQKELNKQLKKSLASFDEIQILSSNTADNLDSGVETPVSGGDLGGGFTFGDTEPDGSKYSQEIDETLAKIMAAVSVALIAIGLILLFTGNVGWGIGFIIAGAALYKVTEAAANDAGLGMDIQGTLATAILIAGVVAIVIGIICCMAGNWLSGVSLIALGATTAVADVVINWDTFSEMLSDEKTAKWVAIGGVLAVVLGIILCCANQWLPGVGLIVLGAGALAADVVANWDAFSEKFTEIFSENAWEIALAGAALVVLGIICCCVNSWGVGIGLIVAGAAGLAGVAVVNWDAIVEKVSEIFTKFGGIIAAAGAALIVLGIILCCTGAGIGIGIGLILAGAAAIAGAVAFNWDAIVEWVENAWKAVEDFWDKYIAPVFTAKFWLDLAKTCGNGLIGGFEAAINGIISLFETMINWIVDALNKISIEIPNEWWVPEFIRGAKFGVNIPKASFGRVSIPRLAQGAVIPPNKEFLAVLGDQKQGLNIETPLATMIEAFQIALDSRGGYNGGGNTEVILEIDGREFGRAVVEQGNRENRRIGTRLVIG